MPEVPRWRKYLMRVILRVRFAAGGEFDGKDPLPRLYGKDLEAAVPLLEAGDFVLTGNHGELTHVALHVGGGRLVHAMGTEQTMRGWRGSTWDVLRRPFRRERHTGVIEEDWGHFFDRYARDVWLALRMTGIDDAGRALGLARVQALVGKGYDYGFSPGDDEYYCTELILVYLEAALGNDAPPVATTHHTIPFLFARDVHEPVALLDLDDVVPVAASQGVRRRYAGKLGEAPLIG